MKMPCQQNAWESGRIGVKSSHDELDIQGWIVTHRTLMQLKSTSILEIHGGPVANYGPHFSAEAQLFAAQGNVVLYMNPRGSDSYGKDFAQQFITTPKQHYHDLMTGVDALVAKGFIDDTKLYVTGGSGGGVLPLYSRPYRPLCCGGGCQACN